MEALNNRELASLIWLAVGLAFCLVKADIRKSLYDMVRAFLHWKILLPLCLLYLYITGLVIVGYKFQIWRPDLLKDTVIWAITTGFVMFFNYDEATAKSKFFRRRILSAFKITVLIEVFVNLFVLNLLAEILLVPFIFILSAMSVVAGMEKRTLPVKRLTDGLLAAIGMFFLIFAINSAATEWATIDKPDLLLNLVLPVWLTIGLLPFVYVLALLASYELAFTRVDMASSDRKRRRRAKLAIVYAVNIHARKFQKLNGWWLRDLTSAKNLSEAVQLIRNH